jgi:hypothetical protein
VFAGGLIAPWISTERDSLFAAPAVANGSIADWLVGAITKANAQRQHQRRFGRRLYQRPGLGRIWSLHRFATGDADGDRRRAAALADPR